MRTMKTCLAVLVTMVVAANAAPPGTVSAPRKNPNASKPEESAPLSARDLLKKSRFAELDRHLKTLKQQRGKDSDGRCLLCEAYNSIKKYKSAKSQVERWITQYPDSYAAKVCLGRIYIGYAWKARGGGWANTVTDEGWKLFRERLVKAREYLEEAYEIDQSDPYVPAMLMIAARGLSLDREEREKLFQRGLKADNSCYRVYSCKLEYLKPKWGGSEQEMFAFARKSARTAPANSMCAELVIDAHKEKARWTGDDAYFEAPPVWTEVKGYLRRWTAAFPNSMEAHNLFAWCAYWAKDYETAKKEFDIIQGNWNRKLWRKKEHFNSTKAEVESLLNPPPPESQ